MLDLNKRKKRNFEVEIIFIETINENFLNELEN